MVYVTLESSDNGPREGLSLSDGDDDEFHAVVANPYEKYLHGLLKGKNFSRKHVDVKICKNGIGRSAFAAKEFKAGDFVCEYASCVKLKTESVADDQRYSSLGG